MPIASRRQMLRNVAAAACMPLIGSMSLAAAPGTIETPDDRWRGLKLGVASYTFRKFNLEQTIKGIRRVGLNYVSIKDFHLPMKSTPQQRKEAVGAFKAAGITPMSCGVVTIQNTEASATLAFEYAKDAGLPTIVCAPVPAAIPMLDQYVKKYDIRLAIHNHGPESKEFRTPDDVWPAIEKYDQRIGLCIDVGHTIRSGGDPIASIHKYRDRLYDFHIRDMSSAKPDGDCVEGGRGIMDLKGILKALLDIKFAGLVGIEYEKDADDPIPGLAETVGYLKGLLAA